MKLSDVAVRQAKPGESPRKMFDGRGLFLLVTPTGGKLWRLKYRIAGREKLLSLGQYPDVSLAKARERREEARRQIADGIDPAAARRVAKLASADTVRAISEEWLKGRETGKIGKRALSASTIELERRRLERFIWPHLGSEILAKVTAPDLLGVLQRIQARGTLEVASRVRAVCGRIWRYAVATHRAESDITRDLREAVGSPESRHFAAQVEPPLIAKLLRDIDGYVGQPTTHAALRLLPLVFVRPGELRGAEWSEFDLEGAAPTWRIPAGRMKMREQHLVPLSRQAVAILRDLEPLTGAGRLVFPGLRANDRPISENTLNAALRRLEWSKSEQTAHGFRTIASTLLNEQGWHPDLIELQLAHRERNAVRRAYNRATRLEERRKMMQAWANYLDALKANQNVIPLRRKRQR